jgi:hypothetical protein
MFRRILAGLLISAAALLGPVHTAGAAKAPALAVIRLDPAYGVPRLGGNVHFLTIVPSGVKNPRIDLYCYQGSTLGWAVAGANTDVFKMGGDSSLWKQVGGSATCQANLYYWTNQGTQAETYHLLASTAFSALG